MTTMTKALPVILVAALLAACGGGGGGSSPTPTTPGGSTTGGATVTSTPTPTPSPTATATSSSSSVTFTGKATDFVTGAPLAGFVVSLGAVPSLTCIQTNSSNSCGVPVNPVTTTTAADGTFTVTGPATSTMLTISPVAVNSYATLHRTVVGASSALGTIKLMALSTDEQNWLTDVNSLRATVAVPTSYSNLTVDEYAQEQATLWTAGIDAGTTPYSDAGYASYQSAYSASPGAMYSAAGVLSIVPNPLGFATTYGSAASGQATLPAGAPGWQASDYAWMYGDKSNCPAPYTWTTCPPNHYTGMSSTLDVWVGLGETSTPDPNAGNQYPYDLMLIQS